MAHNLWHNSSEAEPIWNLWSPCEAYTVKLLQCESICLKGEGTLYSYAAAIGVGPLRLYGDRVLNLATNGFDVRLHIDWVPLKALE